MTTPEKKLESLGLTLSKAPDPLAVYRPVRKIGNTLYLSGQIPRNLDGTFITGRLGDDATIEQGYAAARNVGLQLLSVVKSVVGDLSAVEAVAKVTGMVNATPDFIDWCEGFMDAVKLRAKEWLRLTESGEHGSLMMPILVHILDDNGNSPFEIPQEELDQVLADAADAIPDAVVAIYEFWRQRA